jgi:hypothetical protein
MKRMTTLMATALSLAIATGTMAGCGSQQSQQPAETEATTETTETAEAESPETDATEGQEELVVSDKSQEELKAEFTSAMDNAPQCTSVTVKDETVSTFTETGETIDQQATYKFDESGETPKSSIEVSISDVQLSYYIDGNDVACVTDGPVYSGTVEEFGLETSTTPESYLEQVIGKRGSLADCAATIEKLETSVMDIFVVTLDPQALIASDETLQMLADSGSPVKAAKTSVGFDKEGNIASIDSTIDYGTSTIERHLLFSDYNATTIDPMPEATATYEQMMADEDAKLEEFLSMESNPEATEAK